MSLTQKQNKILLNLHSVSKRIFELNPLATNIVLTLENMEYNDENYYGGTMQFYINHGNEVLDEVTITKFFQKEVKKSHEFFYEAEQILNPDANNITITKDNQFKTTMSDGGEDYDEDAVIVYEGIIQNNNIILN